MQRVGGSIGITVLTVVLSHQMTKIGVTAHATDTVTPSMLSALDSAFGHTFAWSLGITVLALAVASFLPRK
jgi:hypothetical protein